MEQGVIRGDLYSDFVDAYSLFFIVARNGAFCFFFEAPWLLRRKEGGWVGVCVFSWKAWG